MPEISSPAELKAYLLERCSSEEVARRDFFRILDEMEPRHHLDHGEEYIEDDEYDYMEDDYIDMEYDYIDMEDNYIDIDPIDLKEQQDRFWNDPTR